MHLRIILRNILSNWSGYLAASVVAIFLSPLIVHHLGNTGYGIWTLVLSLTGYFGLLDFGIRSSVGRFVARYIALHEQENVSRTVSNAIAILGCGSALTVLATIAMVFAIPSFRLDPNLVAPARIALVLAGLNIAVALPMGVFGGVLIALERYDIVSRVGIVASLTQAGLVVIFLKLGHGFVTLAVIAVFITATQYTFVAAYAKLSYPSLRLSWRFVNAAGWKELFGFSAYRFIYIVANQLIFYSDSVVIGAFLGASFITPFAIAGSLISRGRDVVSLATDTMYPAASRMDGLNDRSGLKELYFVCTKLALLLGLPLCLGFIFLGRQFITLWMGRDYIFSATILSVLTIPQFTSMPQYSSSLILASMARHKALAYMVLAEGIVNLALSIVLVQKMGIIGVAWGTVIPHFINTGIIIPLYTLRIMNIGISEYLQKAVVRPILCAIPVGGVCYVFSVAIHNPTWLIFVAEAGVVCLVSALMAYFTSLNREQQLAIRGKTAEVFSKVSACI